MYEKNPKWVKWMWIGIGAIVLAFLVISIKITFDKMWQILDMTMDDPVQIEQMKESYRQYKEDENNPLPK